MHLVTITNAYTGVAEQHICDSFEIGPCHLIHRHEWYDVTLYGTLVTKVNFPHRDDAGMILVTNEPVKVEPFFMEDRPNGY